MAAMPDPADPGRDDDLAWPDEPDPEEEYCDYDLTAEELAEIRAAAADELVAVAAATTGRRGPGHPGSARVFPGESASTAAAFGTGLALDVRPAARSWQSPPTPPRGAVTRTASTGWPSHELIGLLCAWDRLEAHMAARKLAVVAELFRRNPEEGFEPSAGAMPEVIRSSPRTSWPARWATPARPRELACSTVAQALATRLPGTMAALEDGMISRYKAEIIAGATVGCSRTRRPGRPRTEVLDRAGAADPGRPARRDRPRRHGGRARRRRRKRRETAGEGCPGGAVAAGHRERRADGLRAAPGRGPGGGSADHRVGAAS